MTFGALHLTKEKARWMMVLGFDILLPRVRKGELIKNLSERELTNPEGAGFDLRAAEIYRVCSPGFLGVTERSSSDVELVERYVEGENREVILRPEEAYLVKIVEEIALDKDMLGIFHPRSTLFRSGVVLQTGVHPPGYVGAPTFGLSVIGIYPFRIELGARIAHINILKIEGSSSPYRGQWQDGRVSTDGTETQV
jgi:deoxycytidine triphosphate deaminase